MASLTQIFGTVHSVCLKDDDGVYLGSKKIALNNTSNNAYIRRDGPKQVIPEGGCEGLHTVITPLKLVGAVPGGDPDSVETAVLSAIAGDGDNRINESQIQKDLIAESESITREQLTKFKGVAMIMVSYTEEKKQLLDPNCDYDLC